MKDELDQLIDDLIGEGDFDQAWKLLEECYEPEDADELVMKVFWKSAILYHKEEFEESISIAEEYLQSDNSVKDFFGIYKNLCSAHLSLEKISDAIKYGKIAYSLFKESGEEEYMVEFLLMYNLGLAYCIAEEYESAIKYALMAKNVSAHIDKSEISADSLLCMCLYRANQWDELIKVGLELLYSAKTINIGDEHYAQILRYFAWACLCKQGIKSSEAVDSLIRKKFPGHVDNQIRARIPKLSFLYPLKDFEPKVISLINRLSRQL